MRDAWCAFTKIIENRKSDSTCTSCVMRAAYSFLWSRDNVLLFIYYIVFFSYVCSFLVTLTLFCHATWLMIRIRGKPWLHIRVMREAWCVFTEIIENRNATSHACHAWCAMRICIGLAYSPLWERSTRITRAYHDVIRWILSGTPKILACDPGFQGQPRADQFVDHIVFFSYVCSFLVTITLLCHATWLMIRIWGSWSIWPSTISHFPF